MVHRCSLGVWLVSTFETATVTTGFVVCELADINDGWPGGFETWKWWGK
jgi:hypothetical protein